MTNQTHLNVDCLLDVIEQADFETLLTIAQTNQFYSNICAQSFKRRFAELEIIIENDSFLELSQYVYNGVEMLKRIKKRIPFVKPSNKPQIEITNDHIRIESMQIALKTLRTFGHVIRKIQLKLTNADTIESIAIIRYVEKYCSNSLTELTMRITLGNVLKHLSKPFKKVEHVVYLYRITSAKGQPIPINQLFPSVRKLTFSILDANDDNFLTVHFPHLEHVHIKEVPYVDGADSQFADGLLAKNPQIRSVSLDLYVGGLLQKISKMPQLEHFTFKWSESIPTEVRFENVKKFTADDQMYADPRNLLFPKLQEFEINFFRCNYNIWLAFLRDHLNLKGLHFHVNDITDSQFIHFTSMLHHLEEMYIYRLSGRERESSIRVDLVIKFIENHDKLMKLHLETCDEMDGNILRSKFSGEWTISECGDGLSFERKTPLSIE